MTTENTAAPAAPPVEAPAASPAAAPAAAAASWMDGLDASTRSMIEKDGYKTPADLVAKVRSYAPPEAPDKYELPVPEGESDEFAKTVAAPLFHKAGLSNEQAKVLAAGWNELQTQQRTAATQAEEASAREASALAERQNGDLKREWGAQYDANVELSRRAIRSAMSATGAKDDTVSTMIDAMEKTHGFAFVHKFFSHLGKSMAEDTAHGLGSKATGGGIDARSLYDKSNMN